MRVGLGVAAGSAVLEWKRDSHQVELAEPPHDLVRESLRPVESLGRRRDLALGELADRVAQEPVVVGDSKSMARDDTLDRRCPRP